MCPIFEYECPKHGRFEMLRFPSDDELKTCPICESEVTKVMSAPGGFEFKGKGFYVNEYGRGKSANQNGKQ